MRWKACVCVSGVAVAADGECDVGWGRMCVFLQRLGKKADSRSLSLAHCDLTATDLLELGGYSHSVLIIPNLSVLTYIIGYLVHTYIHTCWQHPPLLLSQPRCSSFSLSWRSWTSPGTSWLADVWQRWPLTSSMWAGSQRWGSAAVGWAQMTSLLWVGHYFCIDQKPKVTRRTRQFILTLP